ncbi:MAG: TonB-dependent receptor [Acidobacteria bacterium]|nr:TonB-dependent receptor [Acidobacteriota bacterium]
MPNKRCRVWVVALWCVLAAGAGRAGAQVPDLSTLSLEDLMKLEITTASRKEQPLSRTAAAVYVITDEDIRRLGARTIPDLLRLVPGFNVAQIDAGAWAVSARGFNSFYANKLLVLVDGRSVYTPLFGGVNWDMQSVPLSDVQRIEVVRGPGGSLWGTNAVNGVVNIITKSAEATQGGLARAVVGGPRGNVGVVRYGGRAGERTLYRVFGRYATSATGLPVQGFDDPDHAGVGQGGVRLDWTRGADDVSIQGSAQNGRNDHVRAKVLLAPPWSSYAGFRNTFTEGNTSARWTRASSSGVNTQVQASYSAHTRAAEYGRGSPLFTEDWQIAEVEARQRRPVGRRHEVVAGLGYRVWTVHIGNTKDLAFFPVDQDQHLMAAFVQDEMALGARVHLTSGLKVERNSFTGLEAQPNLRLAWNPAPASELWASVSRAVRIPSVAERGVSLPAFAGPGPGGLPVVGLFEGSADTRAEVLYAYEGGYRAQFGRVFLDATVFTNEYRSLTGTQAFPPAMGLVNGRAALVVPLRLGNVQDADTHGVELLANWAPVVRWRLSASWSAFRFDTRTPAPEAPARLSPAHQVTVRSYLDLPRRGELTLLAARVGSLGPAVPAYTSVNLRTSWPVARAIDLGFGVENLLHNQAIEFQDTTGFESVPVRTAVFGELSWRF